MHTPGPWQWAEGWDELSTDEYGNPEQKYLDLRLIGRDGEDVVPLRLDHRRVEIDTKRSGPETILPADRQVIAAAPDLLAAARLALGGFDPITGADDAYCHRGESYTRNECRNCQRVDALRAAIRKAEGK
jgi:hypothetical protein